jgi:hypothetical protein
MAAALNRMANPLGKLISAAQSSEGDTGAAIFTSWNSGAEATSERFGQRFRGLEECFW